MESAPRRETDRNIEKLLRGCLSGEEMQPPQQPYPVQPGQTYQPPVAPSPVRIPRWLLLLVVGIVVLVMVGAIVGFAVIPYLRQPKMTITDVQYSNDRGSCDSFFSPAPPQYFTFSFLIHNTGDADGFATVSFIVYEDATGRPFPNPVVFAQNRYFVPSQGAAGKYATVQLNDCYPSHTWNAIISAVEKA